MHAGRCRRLTDPVPQATKQEKEAEFEMQITRMSAPPGLDEEEAEFLNDAVEQAARAEHIRRLQESKELAAYSVYVSSLVAVVVC